MGLITALTKVWGTRNNMKSKRDITKVQALASQFGSGAHIILPKSWKGKRVVCMLKTHFDNVVGEKKE